MKTLIDKSDELRAMETPRVRKEEVVEPKVKL